MLLFLFNIDFPLMLLFYIDLFVIYGLFSISSLYMYIIIIVLMSMFISSIYIYLCFLFMYFSIYVFC